MFELLIDRLPDKQATLYSDENFTLLGDKQRAVIVSPGNPDFALTWAEQLDLSLMILGVMKGKVFKDCEDCESGIAVNVDMLTDDLEPVMINEAGTLQVSASLENVVFCNEAEKELQLCWYCVNDLGNFLIEIDSLYRD